jgi:hypothetical protein
MKQPSKSRLAADLGVSRQMLHRMVGLGMPCTSVQAATRWREERMGPALEAPPAFAESRARIGAAKAAILELELAQKRSELAPIDVMGTAFSAVAGEVKTRIFAVPSRAATMLAEPARRAELEATLHRLLSEARLKRDFRASRRRRRSGTSEAREETGRP